MEAKIDEMRALAIKQCTEATTLGQVLELDDYYFGENGVLYALVDEYVSLINSKIAEHDRFWDLVGVVGESCIKDCQSAVTFNDLTLVKAKYLGKNGIITLMQKEHGNSYKEFKQKEIKC